MNSLFTFVLLLGAVAIYGHPGHNYNKDISAMREIELQNEGSSESGKLTLIDIHKVPETEIPDGAQGAIIKNTRNLWPNNLVHYAFDSSMTQSSRTKVRSALAGIAKVTCIRFKEYVAGVGSKPEHYVRVFSGSGCWSYIGYARFGGTGYQDMSLSQPGCVNEKIIQHEFIHALGAFHEQARNDRDNYINLHKENMVDGAWRQFEKQPLTTIDSRGVPYDAESIMHYSNYAFSKNRQMTISWKADRNRRLGGTKMSDSDIKQLNLLYSCDVNPPPTTTTTTTTTKRPTTTTTTTTTKKPMTTTEELTTTEEPMTTTMTTETPKECRDKRRYCNRAIENHWCRYSSVKRDCPEACGLCGKPKTTTTTTTTTTKAPTGGNGCIDVSNHCSKSYRDCSAPIYQRRCRKTCNQCDEKLPKACKGLSDNAPNCHLMARPHGACDSYRSHCKLSCCLRDFN